MLATFPALNGSPGHPLDRRQSVIRRLFELGREENLNVRKQAGEKLIIWKAMR
jgi:hypothetical protein